MGGSSARIISFPREIKTFLSSFSLFKSKISNEIWLYLIEIITVFEAKVPIGILYTSGI